MRLLSLLLLAWCTTAPAALIYKCENPKTGERMWQDSPCPNGFVESSAAYSGDPSPPPAQSRGEFTPKIGMTATEVEKGFGKPLDINRTTTAYGVHEQWVYGSTYLYFDDGALTAISDKN